MAISKLPGVYYKERVTYELTGDGSKIPIFIGKTGNTVGENDVYKIDGTQVLRFANKKEALKPINKSEPEKGGIVAYASGSEEIPSANELAQVISDFYDEARLLQSSDIGVPYIYVIDVGDGTTLTSWTNAIATSKAYYDAPVEVYVGLQTGSQTDSALITDKISKIVDAIHTATEDLNLRYAYITKKGANDTYKQISNVTTTDTGLKDLSQALISSYSTDLQKLSRLGLIEPLLYGKTVARICCTPNNTEPGYFTYRSVTEDTFLKRTKEDALELQKKGIIFNRDEFINGNKYPKINLCVAVSFNETNSRPADSLFHARFNSDDLLREVFEACYTQVKANETATNIAYLQTRINKIVNDRVSNEEMVKYNEKTNEGTKLTVTTSNEDPYSLFVTGQIQPVKCTIAIEVQATVKL